MKILRHAHALPALLLGALLSASCLAPSGKTVEEKRASALEMRDKALATLYEDKPSLKEKVENSAGYAVFSNFSIHPGLISFANGYGVLTNNETDELTHQRWFRLTLGPGIAVKWLYAVVLFDKTSDVERFAKGPWVAGGQAELGFVFGDFGGALEAGWTFRRGTDVSYTTHTGVAAEIELFGIGKVTNKKKLNQSSAP